MAHSGRRSRTSLCSSTTRPTCLSQVVDGEGETGNRFTSKYCRYKGRSPVSASYPCHVSCRVSPEKPGYFEYLRPYSVFQGPLMKRSVSVPRSFSDSYCLQHPDLDSGQKKYLWKTAAVYSMDNMKALQQQRYKQLLQHQVDAGFHTQEECNRYLTYLEGTRKHQYVADPRVWRSPPKIPVRQKSFNLPPPSKCESPRNYRYLNSYGNHGDGRESKGVQRSITRRKDRDTCV